MSSRSGRSSSSSSSHSNTSNSEVETSCSSPPPSSVAAVAAAAASGTKNIFKNDGSFLEMFKKMQEAKGSGSEKKTDIVISSPCTSAAAPVKLDEPKVIPMVGKRRGGRALPTGMVKKPKKAAGTTGDEEEVEAPKDAWSQYMAEVRRYKETSCEEEGKTRPLVK